MYSGFLGMNIGIRLGAPVEPTIWTYDRIRNTYGEITDYVKEFKNFAADDDANGPVSLSGLFMMMRRTGNWSLRMSPGPG